MEDFVTVRLDHAGEQLLLAVAARGVADCALVLAQLFVQVQHVVPVEGRELHASLSSGFAAARVRSSMNAGTSAPKPVTEGPASSSRGRGGDGRREGSRG